MSAPGPVPLSTPAGRSLVFRLALLQQLLAGALILVFSGSAIWLSARTLERQEAAFLSNAATHMASSLEREWIEESDLRKAARSALEEGAAPGVQVDVLDARGQRVASTATRTGCPGSVNLSAFESRLRRAEASSVACPATRTSSSAAIETSDARPGSRSSRSRAMCAPDRSS